MASRTRCRGSGCRLAALIWLVVACTAVLAQPAPLDWGALRPVQTEFADPFAELPAEHIRRLMQVVRIDQVVAANQGRDASVDAVRLRVLAATRQRLVDEMQAASLSVDDLLSARLAIIAHRRVQAETTVAAIDGTVVNLRGYLLPVVRAAGTAATEVYLVPAPVIGAHAPLPAVNQVVRVRLAADAGAIDPLRSVRIVGRIEAVRSGQSLLLGDGTVKVVAGYSMRDAELVPDDSSRGH